MHKREFRGLICSMLLGDGCLSYGKDPGIGKRGKPLEHSVFYAMNHSIAQKDYALWKAQLIDKIFKDKKLNKACTYINTKKYDPKYDKTYYGIYVKFSWAEYLKLLRTKTYHQLAEKQHIKRVDYLLNNIYLDLHIAIWLMDDGSEKRKRRKSAKGTFLGWDNPSYELYTFKYTEGQHNLIKAWFEKTYQISPTIQIDKKRNPDRSRYLRFSVNDTRKLFYILYPYFAQTYSMRNKFWLSFAKYKPEILETPLEKVDDIVQTTTFNDDLGN